MLRLCLAVLAAASLTGCATLSALGSASETLDIYELRVPAYEGAAVRRANVEIVVEKPLSSGALDTDRILIRPSPLQAQYLPGARWSDPAPEMLQTLLLRSLAETDAFQSVGRRPVGTIGDFAVLGELTAFEASVAQDGSDLSTVTVRLMVRLVRERDAQVVARQTFETTAPAAGTDPAAIIVAFDRATGELLAAFVPWVMGRI